MHRGHGQDLFNGGLLPGIQCLMQLHHVFQDGRLGDHLSDQCLDRLLNPLQRDHLGDQQVQDIGLDAWPILQRTGHVGREPALGLRLATGALLDLGVNVAHHLFKDDVDPGASFVSVTGRVAEVFAAGFALIDFGDLNGLYRPGVAGARIVLRLALAIGARTGDCGIVLGAFERTVCWS